jgi:hypothetical protein
MKTDNIQSLTSYALLLKDGQPFTMPKDKALELLADIAELKRVAELYAEPAAYDHGRFARTVLGEHDAD